MIFAPFESSRIKVLRARYHIRELEFDLKRELYPPRRVTTFDDIDDVIEEGNRYLYLMTATGDTIHNLRAALDLLACDVVALNGKSKDGVYFPFAKNATELEEQIKAKNFNRASPQAIDLLRQSKPYKGGNAALRGLHDLDVLDKHQMVVPVLERLGRSGIAGMPMTRRSFPTAWCPKCFTQVKPLPQTGDFIPGSSLRFPPGVPFAGQEVIPTLHGLAQEVSGIIEAFALLLLPKRSNPGGSPSP